MTGRSADPSTASTQATWSARSTRASTRPAWYALSAVCDQAGGASPVISLTTRGPAKPMMARGSAARTSSSEAHEANTPPVVGDRYTIADSKPARACSSAAAAVRGIWISDAMPSCIRAPPVLVTATTGNRWSTARRNDRTIFSPATAPIVPPNTSKSLWISTARTPRDMTRPVRTDSPPAAASASA